MAHFPPASGPDTSPVEVRSAFQPRAMQVGARMVARAQDVIHLQLLDIDLLATQADLPAPLIDIRRRGESSRSACRTASDRSVLAGVSLRSYSQPPGEKTTGPFRSGGSRRRSSGGTLRTRARPHIRPDWASGAARRHPSQRRAVQRDRIRIKYPALPALIDHQWLHI